MPGHVQQEIGAERAHHIERAMGEIDDVEHAEDHGEPETQQRVERAVDQSDQKLGVERLHIDLIFRAPTLVTRRQFRRREAGGMHRYFFNSGQVLSDSGVNASIGRNRADQLVEIPGVFRFRRLLHLEQIGRMDRAAVGLDLALAEQRIVGRDRFHLVHDLDAVMRIAAERFQRLEIMDQAGIDAGLDHGRQAHRSSSARRISWKMRGSGRSCPNRRSR